MPPFVLIILLAGFPALATDMYLPALPMLQHMWQLSLAQANFWRFSLYVLANTFIPPNNHDFASLRRCSFTRNHAK